MDIVSIRRKNDTVEFKCSQIANIATNELDSIYLSAKAEGGKEYEFYLKPTEVLILACAIESSMGLLAWGEGAAE